MATLITGSAGALASDYIDYLIDIESQEQIVLLDVFDPDALARSYPSNYKYLKVDCSDYVSLEQIFKNFTIDRVLHFAGNMEDGQSGFDANIKSTINVVQLSEKYSRPKLFFPQSFLTRDCSKVINDSSENVLADSSYSVFKSMGERFLRMYNGDFTIAVISSSVSPTLTIGPIPAFTKRLNAGSSIKISDTFRDYLNPRSCSQAIDIASRPGTKLESVAIGSGVSTHTREIATTVCQILGIEVDLPEPTPPTPGDPKKVMFEPSISLRNLGWNPKSLSLIDIERVVKSFMSSGKSERQHHA